MALHLLRGHRLVRRPLGALLSHQHASRPHQDVIQEKIVAVQKAKAAELEKTLATLDDSTLVHEWATEPASRQPPERPPILTNCTACHGADLSATMTVGAAKIPLPGLPTQRPPMEIRRQADGHFQADQRRLAAGKHRQQRRQNAGLGPNPQPQTSRRSHRLSSSPRSPRTSRTSRPSDPHRQTAQSSGGPFPEMATPCPDGSSAHGRKFPR